MEKKHNKNREFKVSELSPLSPVGLQNRVPAGIRRSKSRGAWERVLFSPSRVRDETRVKVIILGQGPLNRRRGRVLGPRPWLLFSTVLCLSTRSVFSRTSVYEI